LITNYIDYIGYIDCSSIIECFHSSVELAASSLAGS